MSDRRDPFLPLFLLVAAALAMASWLFRAESQSSGNGCRRDAAGRVVYRQQVRADWGSLAARLVGDRAEGIGPNLLDLPPSLRATNYAGGSCCHAAIQDVLRWHGFHEAADWWRKNLSGAYSVSDGARQLESLGFRYAYTTTGDETLLDWCSRNRHGAAIHYYPAHAITFRGYVNGYAILQDNNRPNEVIRVPKQTFIRNWKGYGGCALTVVYSPAAPIPRQ